jgi:hypothetical protein
VRRLSYIQVVVGSLPTSCTVVEAKVVEALGCGPRDSEFESRLPPQPSRARQVVHTVHTGEDAGSIPATGTLRITELYQSQRIGTIDISGHKPRIQAL